MAAWLYEEARQTKGTPFVKNVPCGVGTLPDHALRRHLYGQSTTVTLWEEVDLHLLSR